MATEDRTVETVIETQHTDMVHDTQFDYYGRFVATASSDRTIKIFSVTQQAGAATGAAREPIATLHGHEGPVWMLSWAHPRFGNALASCSYDHRAIIWKESQPGKWAPVHIIGSHSSSVNAVQWAPHEFGMLLATAGSDGAVFVSTCAEGAWREPVNVSGGDGVAHPMGAMAVSFAPPISSVNSDAATSVTGPVLASGGCDGKIRLWYLEGSSWRSGTVFKDHNEWVRDTAFNPDASAPFVVLASCGQDGKVVIRRIAREQFAPNAPDAAWEVSTTAFTTPAWRLSWSPCGSMLLVTTGDDTVVLTKPTNFTDAWTKAPVSAS